LGQPKQLARDLFISSNLVKRHNALSRPTMRTILEQKQLWNLLSAEVNSINILETLNALLLNVAYIIATLNIPIRAESKRNNNYSNFEF